MASGNSSELAGVDFGSISSNSQLLGTNRLLLLRAVVVDFDGLGLSFSNVNPNVAAVNVIAVLFVDQDIALGQVVLNFLQGNAGSTACTNRYFSCLVLAVICITTAVVIQNRSIVCKRCKRDAHDNHEHGSQQSQQTSFEVRFLHVNFSYSLVFI